MNKILIVNTRDEYHRIDLNKVAYLESDGNYTHIQFINKMRVTLCMNLNDIHKLMISQLQNKVKIFVRTGKRHIINRKFVSQVAVLRQKLTLSDGENFEFTVSISKEALKKLREEFLMENAPTIEATLA